MLEWAEQAEAFWQYVVLFFIAFAPWLDVSIAAPLGILWGLSPILVGITVFTGNLLLILLLAFFFKQISEWRAQRRQKKGITAPTKRETRSRAIWEKYGIPGLAILAPILVGTDIAALLALTFGSSRTHVVVWMTISLAIWTIVFSVAALYGFSFANFI